MQIRCVIPFPDDRFAAGTTEASRHHPPGFRAALAAAIALLCFGLAAPADSASKQKPAPVTVMPNIGGFGDSNHAAALSPDRRLMTTLGAPATSVTLWDIGSGRPLRTLADPAFFQAQSFTPDGRFLVSAHKDGKIHLWDVTNGRIVSTLSAKPRDEPHEQPEMWSLWIDDAGQLLAAGEDAGVVALWSLAQRKRIFTATVAEKSKIVAVRLSADRSKLLAATRNTITVFDAGSGRLVASFNLPGGHSFFADSIVGDDDLIAEKTTDGCEVDELVQVRIAQSRELVSVDKPPRCDRPKDGDEVDVSFGESRMFALPGEPAIIVARSGVAEIRRWNLRTQRAEAPLKWTLDAGESLVALSPDLKFAVTRNEQKFHIRDFETGNLIRALTSYRYPAESVAVSNDTRHILLSRRPAREEPDKKAMTLWGVDAAAPRAIDLAASKDTTVYDLSKDGAIAVAGNDKNDVILFSLEDGRERQRFSVPGLKTIAEARIAPGGKTIVAVGEDAGNKEEDVKGSAFLIDSGNGTVRLSLNGKADSITSSAFSPDGGTMAAGRRDGRVDVWNVDPARRMRLLPAKKRKEDDDSAIHIASIAFSTDGKFVLGGSLFEDEVYLWNLATGRLVRTFSAADSNSSYRYPSSLAMSRDGKLIVAGLAQRAVSSGDVGADRGGILVWDAATGKHRFTLRGHLGAVHAVAFSPDDRRIVSASTDGSIRYWDRMDGKLLATFAATPDGQWIVVTEAGFFAGSLRSDDLVNVVRGLEAFPVSRFRDLLYRPDLVEQLLKGDPQRRYKDAAQKLDLEKIWRSVAP